MTYEEALSKIHSLDKFGSIPGLERVSKLFSMIEKETKLLDQKFIHVAGTNGKGSVCQMLSSILVEEKLKVGLFISPFIIDFCERIQINNEFIKRDELAENTQYLWEFVEKLNEENIIITEFEFITALAFYTFKLHNCDIIICETGLGGLLDSTNLIKDPLVSVITHIDFDHTNILGESITEIAHQKAGIIKDNSITVTSYQQKEALEIIRDTCKTKSNILLYASDVKIYDIIYETESTLFIYKDTPMSIPLLGKHQIENLRTVLSVIDALKLQDIKIKLESIKKGLEKAKNPGRFEIIKKSPLVILDGAHNPNGMQAFSENVKLYDSENEKVLLIGMLKDKDVECSLSIIDKMFSKIITTNVNNPRNLDCHILKKKCDSICENVIAIDNITDAVEYIKQEKKDVFVSGSLYLISDVRKMIK